MASPLRAESQTGTIKEAERKTKVPHASVDTTIEQATPAGDVVLSDNVAAPQNGLALISSRCRW